MANEKGIETLPKFFTKELGKTILQQYGSPKLVIANNIIAHTDYVMSIIAGVKELIKDDGVFIFENSYFKDMYEKILPDLIYSEHISHYLVYPLSILFKGMGLALFDVENIDVHGGSIRGFVSGKYIAPSKNIEKLIHEEHVLGLLSNATKVKTLQKFANKIEKLGKSLTDRLKQIKAEKKTIAIYGMPAKATTLMYLFNIDPKIIECVFEDAPLKIGLLTPGKHIPVVAAAEMYKLKPDYIVILAWNFADSIMANHKKYIDNGGKFIVPLPELKEYS
jgi:hypothetical protein